MSLDGISVASRVSCAARTWLPPKRGFRSEVVYLAHQAYAQYLNLAGRIDTTMCSDGTR